MSNLTSTLNPEWHTERGQYDWRNYVSREDQDNWDSLPEEQRLAIFEQAEADAWQDEWGQQG